MVVEPMQFKRQRFKLDFQGTIVCVERGKSKYLICNNCEWDESNVIYTYVGLQSFI